MSGRAPWSWLICAAVLAATAAPGLARPTKVAFAAFEGDTGAAIGAAITGALDDSDLEIVGPHKVHRAIERLGFDDAIEDRQLKKLAAELEVDAVVQGALDRRHHKLQLEVYARGRKTKPFTLEVADTSSSKFRKLVRKTMLAKLRLVLPAEATEPDVDADADTKDTAKPKAAPRAKRDADVDADTKDMAKPKAAPRTKRDADADADTDDRAKPKAAPRAKRDAAVSPSDDTPGAAADDGAKREATPRVAARDDDAPVPQVEHTLASGGRTSLHTANRFAARLDVGASMTGRSLRFTSNITNNAPLPYQNAPVPGARFAAEVYPFAFQDPDSWLAGLGVGGDFDQALSLTLHATAESSVAMKITQRRYSAGLRYRLLLGHTATSPAITLSANYGARSFLVARGGLMTASSIDLPDVDYRLVEPGVAFRLPLGRWLALELSGHALLARSAGPIQRPDQYGQASIAGGDASAGVDLVLGDRIALRLAGEATLLRFTFAGTGMLSTNRDGDPSTIDVRGATDRYLGGSATLAVLY